MDLIDAEGINSRGRVKSPRSPAEVHFTVARLEALHQLDNVFNELHVETSLHFDLNSHVAALGRIGSNVKYEKCN